MKARILLFLLLTGALSAQTRVNVGGPQYTDSNGLIWSADTGCTSTSTYSRTTPISGTNDPTLFRTARIGNQVSCNYAVTTPAIYTVTLLFAETDPMVTANSGVAGARPRVMTIYINGQEYYSPLNVMASSAFAAAYTLTTPYLAVLSETSITINVNQIAYQAMLSGIDIEPINTSNSSGYILDSAYPSFLAACNAASTAVRTLLVTQTWSISSGFTCNAALQFTAGGVLKPANSQTVTLGGTLGSAPLTIFDTSLGGAIAAGSSKVLMQVDPHWWGASGDGIADDTVPIQSAFTFLGSAGAGNPRTGRVMLTSPYLVSNTINLKNFAGEINCEGLGLPGEASPIGGYIKWKTGAPSGIPILKYDNSHGFSVRGCRTFGNAANPPSAHWNCSSGAFGGGAASQQVLFENFAIEDTSSAPNSATNGFLADGVNANCDSHVLLNGYISHVGTAVNLTRTQNAAWEMNNVICVASTTCGAVAGTLTAINVSTASNSATDWLFQKDSSGSASQPIIHLIGTVADGSGRWVSDGGVNFGAGIFIAEGGSYNVTDLGGAINDGACGPTSNTSLYAACTSLVKMNSTGSYQVEISGTRISAATTLKPMFNFGGSISGFLRRVRVHSINTACPSWDTTNFLVMTVVDTSAIQDYSFDTSCDGAWRSTDGPLGANAVIQPTPNSIMDGQYNPVNTLTCSGTCTLDISKGLIQSFQVTGNVTAWTLPYIPRGAGRLSITICASGGNFTVASPTYFGGQTFGQWGFTGAIMDGTCSQQEFEYTAQAVGRNQAINAATSYRSGIAP